MRVLFGITGYHFAHLEGILYPRGTSPDDYLRLYSREFHVVELSEWSIREMGREGLERCAAATPADFRFTVAQHLELEHGWGRAIQGLREAISPLLTAGKVGAVVVELANWFHYTKASREQLAQLCDSMKDLPLAIAFGRSDWYRQRVVEGLRKRGVAMVSVQSNVPGASPMPTHTEVTGSFAYFRFMGRRTRYHLDRMNSYYEDCRYTPEELSLWANRIAAIAGRADIYVLFHHHPDASDVYSARLLRQILGLE